MNLVRAVDFAHSTQDVGQLAVFIRIESLGTDFLELTPRDLCDRRRVEPGRVDLCCRCVLRQFAAPLALHFQNKSLQFECMMNIQRISPK